MERKEIEARVRRTLADWLDKDLEDVTLDARFREDLDADSLNRVEAVVALEEEFGVDIPEEEMERIRTVRQAVDLAATRLT